MRRFAQRTRQQSGAFSLRFSLYLSVSASRLLISNGLSDSVHFPASLRLCAFAFESHSPIQPCGSRKKPPGAPVTAQETPMTLVRMDNIGIVVVPRHRHRLLHQAWPDAPKAPPSKANGPAASPGWATSSRDRRWSPRRATAASNSPFSPRVVADHPPPPVSAARLPARHVRRRRPRRHARLARHASGAPTRRRRGPVRGRVPALPSAAPKACSSAFAEQIGAVP